jgi:hypothetical protein
LHQTLIGPDWGFSRGNAANFNFHEVPNCKGIWSPYISEGKVVIRIWTDFEDDFEEWNYLIESMSARIQVVIKAKGG